MTTDRRARRTKALLKEAFIKLLSEKKLNEITVKELCDVADINRGTFYLHYMDIYDLKDKLEEELYLEFDQLVIETSTILEELDSYQFFLTLFQLTEKHAELIGVLLGPNGDIDFSRKMQAIFKERYLELLLGQNLSEASLDYSYSYNFLSSGFTGLIEGWINDKKAVSIEEMARLTNALIIDGVMALRNEM